MLRTCTLSGILAPIMLMISCAMSVCSLATEASICSCLPALEGVAGPRTLVIDRLRLSFGSTCAGECPARELRRLAEDSLALRAWSDDCDFIVLTASFTLLKGNAAAADFFVPAIRRIWQSTLVLKLAWLHSDKLQIQNYIIKHFESTNTYAASYAPVWVYIYTIKSKYLNTVN